MEKAATDEVGTDTRPERARTVRKRDARHELDPIGAETPTPGDDHNGGV
jgi:hypothetical protein